MKKKQITTLTMMQLFPLYYFGALEFMELGLQTTAFLFKRLP